MKKTRLKIPNPILLASFIRYKSHIFEDKRAQPDFVDDICPFCTDDTMHNCKNCRGTGTIIWAID